MSSKLVRIDLLVNSVRGTIQSLGILHTASDNREATIVGELTAPATQFTERYDWAICSQTFNFIFDVLHAIDGVWGGAPAGASLRRWTGSRSASATWRAGRPLEVHLRLGGRTVQQIAVR